MQFLIFLEDVCTPMSATSEFFHDPSSHNPVPKPAGSQRVSPSRLRHIPSPSH